MSTYRVAKDKDNPYVMMNKTFIYDKGLSAKAKGIMCYILSKPDDWVIRISDLVNHMTEGKHAISQGLKELEANGYIHREMKRHENGRFQEYESIVYETPYINPHFNRD